MSKQQDIYDVIVVGGSYAGLSAAMALGRSMRKTLVIDSGMPCNRFTPHSHNFLTQDGKTPAEISSVALEQVKAYDRVTFHKGQAISGSQVPESFSIEVKSGQQFFGKKLIFSTGIKDLLPDLPGFRDCWGKSVIHCPYCHGYEFKGQRTGIWANVDQAFHLAMLVNNLTPQLSIFVQGNEEFSEEQKSKLEQHEIEVNTAEIKSISHEQGQIKAVQILGGKEVLLDALYAGIPFTQSSNIPEALGCTFTTSGHLEVDNMQKTSVPGIYACGDCATPMRSVANAVAAGNIAGAVANMELTSAEF